MFDDDNNLIIWDVKYHPKIKDDLELLKEYYLNKAGRESAINFVSRLDAAFESLELVPRINRMRKEDDIERVLYMHTHNIGVVYRIDDENLEVTVIYVYNTRQDPKTTEHNLRYR